MLRGRHWVNPYAEALDIDIEDIIKISSRYNNRNDAEVKQRESNLRQMIGQHEKVDAYILPQPSGWHCLGARYGEKGHEYMSFTVEKGNELDQLLAKARSAKG